jgi:hypothetical protein
MKLWLLFLKGTFNKVNENEYELNIEDGNSQYKIMDDQVETTNEEYKKLEGKIVLRVCEGRNKVVFVSSNIRSDGK